MSEAGAKRGVQPPKGLLLSLLAQVPLLIWMWPPRPAAWELLSGGALLIAGVVLNIWAERLFRRAGVGVCVFSAVPRLVSVGPYRFTRNPMYLGMALLSAGVTLLTGVLANAWSPVVFFLWLRARFVLPEEVYLHEQLGEEYVRYRLAHPRWLGLPRRDPWGQPSPSFGAGPAQSSGSGPGVADNPGELHAP